ncbi:MAG: AAA family ATPase [Treponema sp.]|nr:AAA family ATPase [Treponema sp.]MCL2271799.1 AAA family ATPase [Treponema sp.]
MFLKRLSIFGFKSFADRTEIEFNDGITALLGPNGCGKSNVVDAVKWVLGEHAMKSLRAEKMEDVIFGGTESRKPLNVAEVTLSIANETGLLPMDMPEIEIKRRLYRSGESEYFLNGAHVRLKDIRELFWDTGVGKTAYSVMEQGKIDQILSSKPEDRRYLFEEAAGITRFRERGAEAERNLARTEENMRQIELILNEVKRAHDNLKIQSGKTLKYRALRDEIFNYELDIQLLRLKQFRYEKDERSETLRRRTADRDNIRAEMEAENRALEVNMDEVNSMEARLVELQKNIYGLALEKNARENEIRLFNEQRSENKIKIGQNEEREKQAVQKINELNDDAAGQDAVVNNLRSQCGKIEENIRSFEENIQLAASRISENEKEIHRAEEEIHGMEKEIIVFEKDLAIITDDIVAELDAGLKKAGYSAAERKSAEEALRETLGRLRTVLAGRKALLSDLTAAASASSVDGSELSRIAGTIADGLEEAAADAEKADSLFKSYREHSPSFIDEFLAPEGIITKKRALDSQIRNAREKIEERRQRTKTLRSDNINLLAKIDEYRVTLENMKVNRAQMNARAQAAEEQARLIRRELSGQESLLKNIRDELSLNRKRLEDIEGRISSIQEEIAGIGEKTTAFTGELENLEKDIRKRNDNVAGRKEIINKRTAELSKVQEALEKIHIDLVQTETEIKNIQENFREAHSRDLMEFEERIFTITAPPAELREKLSSARLKMKELGSVNLMAPEEFTEAKQRYDFLSGQMADLEKARRDLEDLTAEIRQESSVLFLETYNRIKKNFHNMFRRLFGGGRAELRLSDSNHVLESGIEIFAQPPGKKLEHLSLLSGGECSMTAVALLFATYMVKPSPFCLLDEIDAALDEQNVGRFVHLLREFSDSSQFIIITHNKKTVTGAGTLLGVTMEESGVTKLIAVRLENEELVLTESAPPQSELWDSEGEFKDEEIQPEEGRQLPSGINDPKKVTEQQLRPIRARK